MTINLVSKASKASKVGNAQTDDENNKNNNRTDDNDDSMEPCFIDRVQLASRWGCSIAFIKRSEGKDGPLKPTRLGARLVRYRLNHIKEIEAAATAGTVKLDNK